MELSGLSLREIYGVGFNRHFVPSEKYISDREKELHDYADIWNVIHKGSYPELYDVDREWQDFYGCHNLFDRQKELFERKSDCSADKLYLKIREWVGENA